MCIKYKMEVIAQGIQKKIDHLLAMDADFYIVPEMADSKLLKIPDMYEAKWIGEYQKKGLGVIWKRYLNVMDVPSCVSAPTAPMPSTHSISAARSSHSTIYTQLRLVG